MDATQTARAAQRHAYNLGTPDYDLTFELADYEAEAGDTCPLCSEPLDGERFFHLACGERENAEDARWEREGRAEMLHMLDLGGY